MPIEKSEAEIIIQNHLTEAIPAMVKAIAEELEAEMRPIIDKLNQKVSWAREELEDCREELIVEEGEAENMREELKELAKDREYEKFIKIFNEC